MCYRQDGLSSAWFVDLLLDEFWNGKFALSTKRCRYPALVWLLTLKVQIHENCMISQMQISKKKCNLFFSSCISNMFGMFLRQQTNCSVARSETLLLLANEVEQDLEEKYTFLIGLPYHINFLGDSFSVLTTLKQSLCKQWNAVWLFAFSLIF